MTATACGFPDCPETAAADTGMCLLHARVHVSTTGSWLDGDQTGGDQ